MMENLADVTQSPRLTSHVKWVVEQAKVRSGTSCTRLCKVNGRPEITLVHVEQKFVRTLKSNHVFHDLFTEYWPLKNCIIYTCSTCKSPAKLKNWNLAIAINSVSHISFTICTGNLCQMASSLKIIQIKHVSLHLLNIWLLLLSNLFQLLLTINALWISFWATHIQPFIHFLPLIHGRITVAAGKYVVHMSISPPT